MWTIGAPGSDLTSTGNPRDVRYTRTPPSSRSSVSSGGAGGAGVSTTSGPGGNSDAGTEVSSVSAASGSSATEGAEGGRYITQPARSGVRYRCTPAVTCGAFAVVVRSK